MHSFEYYKNLNFFVFDSVYEPAEDSFMLAEHARNLKGRILEIGCGSGIVALVNAKANPENVVTGVDINPEAVACAIANAWRNGIKNAQFHESDLFSHVKAKFDYMLFNPPYLPAVQGSRPRTGLNFALDGGRNGRKTIDRFLAVFDRFLEPHGKALVVHSSLNNVERTARLVNKKGFLCRVLETQKFFFETLYVLELSVNPS